MKIVKLICVSDVNNNKYYDMVENSDGTFTAKYGRIGSTEQIAKYSMQHWEKKYKEKIRKGYIDRTDVLLEKEETASNPIILDIDNKKIEALVRQLQLYATTSIQTNYKVSSNSVTLLQVNEAQSILNELISLRKKESPNEINKALLQLYSVIPRRMGKVSDYLLDARIWDSAIFDELINSEQKTLDVMSGQVKIHTTTNDSISTNKSLLDSMGISISEITKEEVTNIQNLLGGNKSQFEYAFKVINNKRQQDYDSCTITQPNVQLLWHGSRNENWWSILEMGLLLRPTNVVTNGKMFGYGIYFADKAQKSIGYSSLQGSYWSRGSDNNAFLALFSVKLGNQLHVHKYQTWCSLLNEHSLKQQGDYHSLFAHGGVDLRNNEFIIYNQNQTTISYVVAIHN